MSNTKLKFNKGAAMMMFIVFLTFGSLLVIIGIVTPVVREFQIARSNLDSKNAYFLAESGVEDAFYRVKNNKQISSSETITIGSYSAVTTITSVSGAEKSIKSVGTSSGNDRTVTLVSKTGTGVVFKYGSQSGMGGVVLKNNAGLYGSFYSDGNILGENGSFITGDAYAANSPALSADQSNTTPTPPTNNIIFGNANGTQDMAQSFQLSELGLINKVQLYIKKVGSPSNATVRIVSDSSGSPSSTTIASGTLSANVVTTSYGWIDVAMSTNPELLGSTTYWIVIDASSDSSNYYTIGGNTGYANGAGKIGRYGSSWSATSPSGLDIYFGIYLGGLTATIDNVDIGQNGIGDAYANNITNSTIVGTAYCKIGSGNNKACNTSRDNPAQENLPISDANIADWKSDAEAGGVINGNYTISSPTSLGPKKIVGNLTIDSTLTITNTIWVTGNIYINIGSTVKLNSSYGATTGIIVADGTITIANNVTFQDSGTSGSYIMILSTSVCDEDIVGNPCGLNDAINVQNNSSIVIASAPHGTVAFSNNAGVKEVVANKIRLKQNATITYGTGLININFSSGPLGSWNLHSWNETQ